MPWWNDFYKVPTLTKEFTVQNSLFFKSTDKIQQESKDNAKLMLELMVLAAQIMLKKSQKNKKDSSSTASSFKYRRDRSQEKTFFKIV